MFVNSFKNKRKENMEENGVSIFPFPVLTPGLPWPLQYASGPSCRLVALPGPLPVDSSTHRLNRAKACFVDSCVVLFQKCVFCRFFIVCFCFWIIITVIGSLFHVCPFIQPMQTTCPTRKRWKPHSTDLGLWFSSNLKSNSWAFRPSSCHVFELLMTRVALTLTSLTSYIRLVPRFLGKLNKSDVP